MNTANEPVWPEIDPRDRRLFVRKSEMDSGEQVYVNRFFADLNAGPEADAGLSSQLLFGDQVVILQRQGAKARVRNNRDGYVGWVERTALSTGDFRPTHRVTASRTFLYPGPDLKLPRTGYRSMGSLIEVTGKAQTRGTSYALLADDTAVVSQHIAPIAAAADDFVAVAERLIATPYLWGGNTGFGIDCSGLVQLSMLLAGEVVLRDSDMQAATIGSPIAIDENWKKIERGDLIFWRGHVAICQGSINGAPHIIHANAHTMDVTSEPVEQAVQRIAHLYEMPIGVRRP